MHIFYVPIPRHGPVHVVVLQFAAGGLEMSIPVDIEVSPMTRVIELQVEQLSLMQEVVQFINFPSIGCAVGPAS